MTRLQLILAMIGIMGIQNVVIAFLVFNPLLWLPLTTIYWLLAGVFWYLYIVINRDHK